MRTLQEFFRYEDNLIGANIKTDGSQKQIRSPNTGNKMVVPGYEEDFLFQNDRRKVDINIDKITSTNWNWERFHNKVIVKRDRIQPAVPFVLPPTKEIQEV